MIKHFVIFSYDATMNDTEHEGLYWSNSIGWVSLPDASVYTEKQMNRYHLTPDDGVWVQLPR